jgi:branched-chain amino acid transport system ATP-binding protein
LAAEESGEEGMKPEPILTLTSVSKYFGGVQAVHDLTLEIPRDGVYGLIGPNGAGKTTVFNLVTGVYPSSKGSIRTGCQELTRMKPFQITRLGVARTFQTIRLFKSLTTLEHVRVAQRPRAGEKGAETSGHKRRERDFRKEADEILDLLGLGNVRSAQAVTLPYGTQRKVEIARALAMQPRLLLLDEPAAGLNTHETEDLLKTLDKIRRLGITLLIIEHDMRMIMGICDHIFVLNFGELIAEGAPEAIRRNDQVIGAYLGKED